MTWNDRECSAVSRMKWNLKQSAMLKKFHLCQSASASHLTSFVIYDPKLLKSAIRREKRVRVLTPPMVRSWLSAYTMIIKIRECAKNKTNSLGHRLVCLSQHQQINGDSSSRSICYEMIMRAVKSNRSERDRVGRWSEAQEQTLASRWRATWN